MANVALDPIPGPGPLAAALDADRVACHAAAAAATANWDVVALASAVVATAPHAGAIRTVAQVRREDAAAAAPGASVVSSIEVDCGVETPLERATVKLGHTVVATWTRDQLREAAAAAAPGGGPVDLLAGRDVPFLPLSDAACVAVDYTWPAAGAAVADSPALTFHYAAPPAAFSEQDRVDMPLKHDGAAHNVLRLWTGLALAKYAIVVDA